MTIFPLKFAILSFHVSIKNIYQTYLQNHEKHQYLAYQLNHEYSSAQQKRQLSHQCQALSQIISSMGNLLLYLKTQKNALYIVQKHTYRNPNSMWKRIYMVPTQQYWSDQRRFNVGTTSVQASRRRTNNTTDWVIRLELCTDLSNIILKIIAKPCRKERVFLATGV